MALTRLAALPGTGTLTGVFHAGGAWFVVRNNAGTRTIYWSTDLATWTATGDAAATGSSGNVASLAYADAVWFLCRNSGTAIASSPDLTTWAAVAGLPTGWATPNYVAAASDGTTTVLVNWTNSGVNPQIVYSTDLATWTHKTGWDVGVGTVSATYAREVFYFDGRWFIFMQDVASTTTDQVFSGTTLTGQWATHDLDYSKGYRLIGNSACLFLVPADPTTDTSYRWNSNTNAFVAIDVAPDSVLYSVSAGRGDSIVSLIDNAGGWSDFANAQVFAAGAWNSSPIGTPDSPIVLADDLYDWAVGNAGILFVSVDTGTVYLDFLAATTYANASVPTPLGAPAVLATHDFTAALGDAVTYYVMDLETPGGLVRVPISSWQATMQTDEMCYVQCVVPACADWIEDLGDATEFVISRRVVLADDSALEYEMSRAPLQTLSTARGPTNFTATISGYTDALTAEEDPPTAYDRTLTGLRAIFTTSGLTRARCSIDWLLRPGHRAYIDGDPIIVDYITYYCGGGDAYMDVGERA